MSIYLFLLSIDVLTVINTNANLIISVGGAITVLSAAVVFFKRKFVKSISERLKKIDTICDTLGPNGGKSLYDRLVAMDKRLAIADARGKALTSSINIIEWQTDKNGNCTFMNWAASRLTNRPESDFLGRNWVNVVPLDERSSVVNEWESAVTEIRDFDMEHRWMNADGTEITVHSMAKPLVDSVGEVNGWLGTTRLVS